MASKNVAVFIPTLNAARTVCEVIRRIPTSLKGRIREIFVIDNDSTDNTYETAMAYKKQKHLANLQVFKNDRNLGYGGSQKRAYEYAVANGFDYVVMLHGDAQYAPEELPALLDKIERSGADLVFGSRMTGSPLKGGMPIWKWLGNRALTLIENVVLGLKLSEYHSGYRIFRVDALRRVPFARCASDYYFDTDIIIQFRLAEMKIDEATIPTHYGKESNHPSTWALVKYSTNIMLALLLYLSHRTGLYRVRKFDVASVSLPSGKA